MSNMTPAQEAAAFHGMATNPVWPLADRLQMALQALDFHEADRELTQPVIETAKAYVQAWHGLDRYSNGDSLERLADAQYNSRTALVGAVDNLTQQSAPVVDGAGGSEAAEGEQCANDGPHGRCTQPAGHEGNCHVVFRLRRREIPDAVYEAAAVAVHDADCGDSICSAGIIHSVYGRGARAAVDTVAPLLLAEGRRQAAEAIRAQIITTTPIPKWAQSGGRPTASGLRDWAAAIAEGTNAPAE